MTSASTYDDTWSYLEKNVSKFGISLKNVHIFMQNQMPCFDKNGNFILADKAKLAMAPSMPD